MSKRGLFPRLCASNQTPIRVKTRLPKKNLAAKTIAGSTSWLAPERPLLGGTGPRSRGAMHPSLGFEVPGFFKSRAQGKPGASRTRSLACSEKSTRAYSPQVQPESRPSLRNGFNGVVLALPGVRDLLVTVVSGFVTRKLDASPGASGPHAFAVRIGTVRQAQRLAPDAACVHRIPPAFVTTRDPPLLPGGTGAPYDRFHLL
jgi:hypothetical protein